MVTSATIARVSCYAFRQPLDAPMQLSFGTLKSRAAVFARIEDKDGAFGWGEIFANWPIAGAEHRCRLLAEDIAGAVIGRQFTTPDALLPYLTEATKIRAVQCGEPGPFAQVIAGLDVALWDLFARRAGLPLARMISASAGQSVPIYASGIALNVAEPEIERARSKGFDAFKVKVGFSPESEPEVLARLSLDLSGGERLIADANQAFDLASAQRFLEQVSDIGLHWLEEPIIATAPREDWKALAQAGTPLASGENITGNAGFRRAIDGGALAFIQPDLAKWGGISGCFEVAKMAIQAGRSFCPHFLGGGIGLTASAHLLAAAGGDGALEVDTNPNQLRDSFGTVPRSIADGHWSLDLDKLGLGIDTLPEEIQAMQSLCVHCSATSTEYSQ